MEHKCSNCFWYDRLYCLRYFAREAGQVKAPDDYRSDWRPND